MRALIIGAIALALSACATIPKGAAPYARAADAPAGFQNVYIYRVGAFPTKRTPTVMIDDVAVFDPPETAYTVVRLKEGKHQFSTHWSWDTGAPALSAPFTVGHQTMYLKLSGDFSSKMGWPLITYTFGSGVRQLQATSAEAELSRCCRYMAPSAFK
jgi:hypothetical protein